MKTFLVADEFVSDYIRGGQLDDAALLSYIDIDIHPIRSSNLTTIDKDAFYIIGNFIGIPENIKLELSQTNNYIIFEKDHKYALVPNMPRHPLVWPDGIVPKDKLMWEYFYNGARSVICMTQWHQELVQKNLPNAKIDNIHGALWTKDDIEAIKSYTLSTKRPKAMIHNNIYKNPNEAIEWCKKNKIQYNLVPDIKSRNNFLSIIGNHEYFVFFPQVPETCSRVLVEASMMNTKCITNDNSGAAREYWWGMSGLTLISEFENKIIPNAVKKFKGYIQ
jgi:hypothetical protein